MGEVMVKVKLTNAFDESLARRGQLKTEEIRRYEADALVDTGAVSSVIPQNVMKQLGVLAIGNRVAEPHSKSGASRSTGSQNKIILRRN